MSEIKILLDFEGQKDTASINNYLKREGYKAASKVLKEMKSEDVIEEVKASGLRGRGGAGFPTGLKWSFVPKDIDKPRYLVCNADEGEPGTFKDRVILGKDPHKLIEGMIIGGFAIGSHQGYIYIRGEFAKEAEVLNKAISEAYDKNYLGKNIFGSEYDFDITVHRGAGAYVCGEETALLNSIEGKKGQPRVRPPFPAIVGLYESPTIINNVESLSVVPWIIRNGAENYAKIGTEKSKGTKLFSISGHVNKPGVYEAPLGTPLMDFVNEYAGGVTGNLKAIIPGGSSTPILRADEVENVNLDYESMQAAGTMLGSGAIIVMNDTVCIPKSLAILTRFYHHESCGQCTPCREGTGWVDKIMWRIMDGRGRLEDLDLLTDVANNMMGKTICPLADAAAMPVISYIKKFRDEFEEFIKLGKCPEIN